MQPIAQQRHARVTNSRKKETARERGLFRLLLTKASGRLYPNPSRIGLITMISADFRLAFLLLIRSRAVLVCSCLAIVVGAFAWLAGQFSPRQPDTVALDIGISLIRIVVPVFALLQIQDLLSREVERRLIFTSLTFPRPRWMFLIGRYVAVVAMAALFTILLLAVVAAVVTWGGPEYRQGTKVDLGAPFILTGSLVWLDAAVVIAFGVALASIATTPHLVLMGGIGFMIIGRSASTIVALLEREAELVKGADLYHQGLQWTQWIIPDLAALDVRPIALYGKLELLTASPWAFLAMPIGYVTVLLVIACYRFEKRQFA
jgi:ABC-type transport system involved in multi-copper enzyme maturation permease subunit